MVAEALHQSALDMPLALDAKSVRQLLEISSDRLGHLPQGGDAIGLLDAQFSGAAHRRHALRAEGEGRDHGELVNQGGHLRGFDLHPHELALAHEHVTRGLDGPAVCPSRDLDPRAHALQHRKDAGASRIQSDARDPGLPALRKRGGGKQEGRVRDVPRHVEATGRDQLLPAHDADAVALAVHPGAELAQHALGVVARRHEVGEHRLPRCVEGRQHHRGLHLCGRQRQRDDAAGKPCRQDGERRPCALVTALDARAEHPQRFHHATHRARAQRIVTGQHGEQPGTGKVARGQSDQGTGILAVERG